MCCVQVSSKHALIWKHKDTWGAFKVSKRWLIKFWSHSDPFHRSLPLVGLTHIYSSFAANWDVSCQVPLNSETLVALGAIPHLAVSSVILPFCVVTLCFVEVSFDYIFVSQLWATTSALFLCVYSLSAGQAWYPLGLFHPECVLHGQSNTSSVWWGVSKC